MEEEEDVGDDDDGAGGGCTEVPMSHCKRKERFNKALSSCKYRDHYIQTTIQLLSYRYRDHY
jgi:hypothetical protein